MAVEPEDSFCDAPRLACSLNDDDVYWFREGRHCRSYQLLGAACELNPVETEGADIRWVSGIRFRAWIPHARRVRVSGSFNQWDGRGHEMRPLGEPGEQGGQAESIFGFWELFIPGLVSGVHYRYDICLKPEDGDVWISMEDPAARYRDISMHGAACVLPESVHVWKDGAWLGRRAMSGAMHKPQRIHELQPADLREGYRASADRLIARAIEQQNTHVLIRATFVQKELELLDEALQNPGCFALSSREGCPDDVRFFINACHVANLGVIVDWTPGYRMQFFDASAKQAHEGELCSLMLSSACYWLEEFHADGLRILVPDDSQLGMKVSSSLPTRCLALLETVVHRDFPGVQLLRHVQHLQHVQHVQNVPNVPNV